MKISARRLLTFAAYAGLSAAALQGCVLHTKSEVTAKIDAHIVLDIRQVKSEASDVEDYVRGDKTAATDATKAPALQPVALHVGAVGWSGAMHAHYASASAAQTRAARWLAVFDLATPAYAQDAKATPAAVKDAKPLSDAEKKALDARKARFDKVLAALKDGSVGETDRGYLEVLLKAPADNKDLSEKVKALGALVKDENADRRTIYVGAAARNGGAGEDAAKLAAVEAVFAESIRGKLAEGQMFKAPSDKAAFEDFKKTKLGQQYPDAKAGDWLKKKALPAEKN